jgi:aminomethyltransferase
MLTPGYQALHDTAAVIDVSTRGRIRVTGEDRKRLLHAMTTNHVQDLQPGQSLYAFFLNAQGRIQADVFILCTEDSLILDLEPETREKIYQHLDRFIIADDVTLEDITDSTAELAIEGPQSPQFRREGLLIEGGLTGQPGFRLIVPIEAKQALLDKLPVQATAEDARAVRIENGVPRYGEDFTDATLAQETQRMHAVHFNKGCYLGQEIVERVRSRGHVNKLLAPLTIETSTPPAPGTKVQAGDKEVGDITSAVFSPRHNAVRALALLRAEFAKPGAALSVAGAPAQTL